MDQHTRTYFAYGSNLHREQMRARCPTAEPLRPFVIKNWRLVFRGVADIEPSKGSSVMGLLWSVRPRDEAALDLYEGLKWDLYQKHDFRLPGGEPAFLYLMTDRVTMQPPPKHYYATIEEGYKQWGYHLVHLEQARDLAARVYGPSEHDDDWLFARRRVSNMP